MSPAGGEGRSSLWAAPLINLARLEAFHLLPDLYETLLLSEAVWKEVVVEGEEQPGAHTVRNAEWIERRTVTNWDLVRALRQNLDPGEAEAVDTDAAVLLMDERHGRETASHFDIPHLGLIGVLIDAKENRHIDAIQPHLDALQREAGFWISDDLYRRVLRDEGEL